MNSASFFTSSESEKRWRDHMRHNYITNHGIPPCVFQVPNSLRDTKPQAYIPQIVGIGPYHHFRPELQLMESVKRAVVKDYLEITDFKNFIDLVDGSPQEFERIIRSCYDRYLDLDKETLSWIVIVDGIFLLHFIDAWLEREEKKKSKKYKIYTNFEKLVPDVFILENQIPIIILLEMHKLLKLTFNVCTDTRLFDKFFQFCSQHSPLDLTSIPERKDEAFDENNHMLHFMYQMIMKNKDGSSDDDDDEDDSSEEEDDSNEDDSREEEDDDDDDQSKSKDDDDEDHQSESKDHNEDDSREEEDDDDDDQSQSKDDENEDHQSESRDDDNGKADDKGCWNYLRERTDRLAGKAVNFRNQIIGHERENGAISIRDCWKDLRERTEALAGEFANFFSECFGHAVEEFNSALTTATHAGLKIPGNIQKISQILQNLEKTFQLKHNKEAFSGDKIEIPSVSRLMAILNIKFMPLPEGSGIGNIYLKILDGKKYEFHLPVIYMRANSEVILRNLVAYEATICKQQQGSTRLRDYVDLMCGLIRSEKDVKVLEEAKIIINDNKIPHQEIVTICNGIKKSDEKPDEKSKVHSSVQNANNYFNKAALVKFCRWLMKFIAHLVKILKPFFPVAVLLLLGLQYRCQVVDCRRRPDGEASILNLYLDDHLEFDPQAKLMLPRKVLRY